MNIGYLYKKTYVVTNLPVRAASSPLPRDFMIYAGVFDTFAIFTVPPKAMYILRPRPNFIYNIINPFLPEPDFT